MIRRKFIHIFSSSHAAAAEAYWRRTKALGNSSADVGSRYSALPSLSGSGQVPRRAQQLTITGEHLLRLRHANGCTHVLFCHLSARCATSARGRPSPHPNARDTVSSVGNHGLASLLRPNNNSTHHGVDAAAPHAFSGFQAQHREAASSTVDGDDAHDSTVVKDRNLS